MSRDLRKAKDAVAAPGLIDRAQQLQQASQGLAAQQQATMAAGVPAGGIGAGITPSPAFGTLSAADRAPIGGVTIELYAERGIAAADWHAAVAGWNQRMAANPAVALELNRLYQGG